MIRSRYRLFAKSHVALNPYDLRVLKDLIAFARDCMEAERECPQSGLMNFPAYELKLRLGQKEWRKVLEEFAENDTLWNSGYVQCLSERAKDTFLYADRLREKALICWGDAAGV